MRSVILALWLTLPIAAWAFHKGSGQEYAQLDTVDDVIARAEEAFADEDWDAAITGYTDALDQLPDIASERTRRELRLKLNLARMQFKQLPTAQEDLTLLAEEMAADPDASLELLAAVREANANAQYYITWLMRLEGYTREAWEPEIERSRQLYRLVAETAGQSGDQSRATKAKEGVEAAIRLARLDIEELQGLPLPNQ